MDTRRMLNFKIAFVVLVIGVLAPSLIAETLYLDSRNGNDANPGTKEKPLRTINQAAIIANGKTEAGPTTIKISPGIYNFTRCVVFKNTRPYTEKERLIIEATILPDDPNWKPALMPVILSTEDAGKPDVLTETYSLKIKINHVTIRGLKFLGNPLSNNWHCCIERIGTNLNDLVVTQCKFVGDNDSFDIYCPIIATGNKLVVDHCIFRNCHASVVFWDGTEGVGGKNNIMRYCIVDGGLISGVWTCQTVEDFEFHHNIITNSQYFWMRKPGDQQKYRLADCIVTNNKYYSGYGNASGPTGQSGSEVTFEEKTVIKEGKLILEKDKKARNYLHPVPGTLGSDLGAGLFTKLACEIERRSVTVFEHIYPHAVQGNIKKILEILGSIPNENLTKEQIEIKEKYYKRFRGQNGKAAIKSEDTFVRYIVETFHNYWRKVFLQQSLLEMAERELQSNIKKYLFENNLVEPSAFITFSLVPLDKRIKKILRSKGYYSIMGRTRPYRELMIWEDQTEREYVIQLPEGEQRVKVVFMGKFVSHGWVEYATLGRSRAGGWTTKDAIYCLKSYDVSSENFRVSLLVHEGQHFADYKSFPKLKQADLEYRAKLAELSKAKETIYSLLKSFKDNSKYDKKHPHQFAEYCLIRDLSKILFNQDFVSDMKRWESIPYEKINEASAELLKRNTKQLKSSGAKSVTELLN